MRQLNRLKKAMIAASVVAWAVFLGVSGWAPRPAADPPAGGGRAVLSPQSHVWTRLPDSQIDDPHHFVRSVQLVRYRPRNHRYRLLVGERVRSWHMSGPRTLVLETSSSGRAVVEFPPCDGERPGAQVSLKDGEMDVILSAANFS